MNQPEINVTPLIDVLLVLLIIFMVITPIKPSSLDANIPSEPKPNDMADVNPDALVLVVRSDDTLRLNQLDEMGTVADPQPAIAKLKEIFRLRTENLAFNNNGQINRSVFIKAPKTLSYGSVAKVVDAVKRSGAGPIGLQIDQLD